MELPKIGKTCSNIECKQLDFLPFQCKCGLFFCKDHLNSHFINCQILDQLPKSEMKTFGDVLVCSHDMCKERSLVPLICERCHHHFCIKHRHLVSCTAKDASTIAKEKEKFAEPVRKFQEAKTAVDKQLASNLEAAKKKGKNVQMANRLQLMKIKSKAVGQKTIPVTDRIYFNFTFDTNTLPVFVSKLWSVGRIIDAVAQEMKLQNNNNKSGAKKLRLFHKEDGKQISEDLSVMLSKLLEEQGIVEGENLMFHYIDI